MDSAISTDDVIIILMKFSECVPKLDDMKSMIEWQKVKGDNRTLFNDLFPIRELAASLNMTRAWVKDRLDVVRVVMGQKDPHNVSAPPLFQQL